ncbi:tRNA (N6-threonylcarbamoyladenosine(37)-N6)-methyltransferase TrmO [Desulfobotulus mexicanus]|uniref:tRNA (N6-threonylcarbamoyladenosine(37)-N6)-methyltransferase TrmO n=1 Tax=Desulfobotulus mexicanus TaxID=2586642 RepID=A0A5Q4VDT3_9BACT|nr:tRNA (N6-threonylcarbamoyladenosine(37)-N6)-methyltransferase TrmO [Desulfobotulus mexicanus]TYT75859.1 tRNA (N6-threonylcarbamoyladenosine(37)-N6)-methyltransferase TrmO [Desulfobotulus mexicanus]
MESYAIPVMGVIHSSFHSLEDMPIQPVGALEVKGHVTVKPDFHEGLKDLEGFSHIYLIYVFHGAKREQMRVIPFMDTEERGVFATRSPLRPSHLGLSVVELLSVDGGRLEISGVDVLDGTPLLDIKPYIPAFDHRENVRSGWMQHDREEVISMRSDERFI